MRASRRGRSDSPIEEAELISEFEQRRGRFLHRHVRRGASRPSSAHVADIVRPSPARAEPHDAAAWLPVPEPDSLPSVEHMLATDSSAAAPGPGSAQARAVPADAPSDGPPVAVPSPARAEPHDATAWLPLPKIEGLPSIKELLVPAEPQDAVEVAVALPSPARAAPHDATAWLPLPDVSTLPALDTEGPTATPRSGSTRRHRQPRRRRLVSVRSALAATVVVAIAYGAFVGASRLLDAGADVKVRVDGKVVSTETGVSTVASLLREQKVTVGDHDRVVPSPAASIENGMVIRVLRAFPIAVEVDGVARSELTTRHNPQVLLAELNLGPRVVIRSAPARIAAGAAVVLRTKKQGSVIVDGRSLPYDVDADTVQQLLDRFNITLGPDDTTKPLGRTDPLPADAIIAVVRVNNETVDEVEPYTLPDQHVEDPAMDVSADPIVVPGTAGTQTVTYVLVHHNDAVVAKNAIAYTPVVPAVATVITTGTKYNPRWDRIADCETGGNWAAKGFKYQGGTGIYYKNWSAYGGKKFAPTAGQATKLEQIIVAERIKNLYGWGAWGCGKTLGYAKEDGKRLP